MNINFSDLNRVPRAPRHYRNGVNHVTVRAEMNTAACDGRGLPPEQLEALRHMVVAAHSIGLPARQVADVVGLSVSAVRNIVRRYTVQGQDSLRVTRHGYQPGQGRLLNTQQEDHMAQLLLSHQPVDLDLSFQRWTAQAVAALLLREFGVALSVRCVRNYMQRWGVSSRKAVAAGRTGQHSTRRIDLLLP